MISNFNAIASNNGQELVLDYTSTQSLNKHYSNNKQELILDDASSHLLNQLKWEMIKGNNVILVVLEFLTHR